MAEQESDYLWTQPGWREQADAWIHIQLARLGRQAIGPIEHPHLRAWSTVLRVPTKEGMLFFKATAPGYAQEAALTELLARQRPDCVPPVLAVDRERSWMLMTDCGVTLRSLLQKEGDIDHWKRILPLYAGLQIEMAGHVSELLALGLPDHRLATLPSLYGQLLADTETLRIGHPEGLTAEEYDRLQALTPQFASLCAQLAAYGVPETLQHDDLHDNNILVCNGRYTLFDWGDSCLSHPFFSLLVVLRNTAWTLAIEENDPAILALRDLYLASWKRRLPTEDLLPAFALAYRLAMIGRALTWHRLVSALEGPLREKYVGAVAGWLQEFLQNTE